MLAFPSEQVVVKREYGNACYSSSAYYLSKAFFLSLARGGQSVLVAMVIYFMAGIYPRPLEFGNVVVFFFALVIVVIWSSCAGLMFGIIVPDASSAAAISMPFLLIQILFSGFYLTRSGIPPWCVAQQRCCVAFGCAPCAEKPLPAAPLMQVHLGILHLVLPIRARHCRQEPVP